MHRRLFWAALFALMIAASPHIPGLPFLVVFILWEEAIFGLMAVVIWHNHRQRFGLKVRLQIKVEDVFSTSSIATTALVTSTALLSGYPNSAAIYLTGRMAMMWVAWQQQLLLNQEGEGRFPSS